LNYHVEEGKTISENYFDLSKRKANCIVFAQ